ncbi:MAG: hypothetical protein ACREJB_00910, partial [Planctomycetaceae bacterium]
MVRGIRPFVAGRTIVALR